MKSLGEIGQKFYKTSTLSTKHFHFSYIAMTVLDALKNIHKNGFKP